MELQNVVLVDGVRSAFARGARGAFVATRMDDVAVSVVEALLDRNPDLDRTSIDELGLGNVMGISELPRLGSNHVARLVGLPETVCTFDSNRQCGSSMEVLHRIAQEIMVGAIDTGVALGAERMGRTLVRDNGEEKNRITEFNQKRLEQTPLQRNLSAHHEDDFSQSIPDFILDSTPVLSMVQTAQNVAETYGLSRQVLDDYAVESHGKYGAAFESGFYKDEIISVDVERPVFNEEKTNLYIHF